MKETWRCETCRIDGMSLETAMRHLGSPHGFDFHLVRQRIVPLSAVGPGVYPWSFERRKVVVEYTRTVESLVNP